MKKKVASILIVIISLLLMGMGLQYAMHQQEVLATTSEPGFDFVLPGQNAPAPGRPAPYGQVVITHNNLTITTTENLGTVAKTIGYDPVKALMCDVGSGVGLTVTVYARMGSTGNTYVLTDTSNIYIGPSARVLISMTEVAPWMSLGLTSDETGISATCGILLQTP